MYLSQFVFVAYSCSKNHLQQVVLTIQWAIGCQLPSIKTLHDTIEVKTAGRIAKAPARFSPLVDGASPLRLRTAYSQNLSSYPTDSFTLP